MAFEIEYEVNCYCRKCRKGFQTRQGYETHMKAKHASPPRGAPIPEEHYSAADEEIDRTIFGGKGRLWR